MLRTDRMPLDNGDGTCSIKLTRGFVATIDAVDADLAARYVWCADVRKNHTYAKGGPSGSIYLHRWILAGNSELHVDHINGDGLDNRRSNLRLVTRTQNTWNMQVPYGDSKYKGVSRSASRLNPWRASICRDGERVEIGIFADEESAARAYNQHAEQMFGEYACLNDVADGPILRHSRYERNRSGYKGVCLNKYGTFDVRIWLVGSKRAISGGVYQAALEAAKAYDAQMFELYGDSAKLNFPSARLLEQAQ